METLLFTAVCIFTFFYTYYSKSRLEKYILNLCKALEDAGKIMYLQTEIMTETKKEVEALEEKIKKLTPKQATPKKKKS